MAQVNLPPGFELEDEPTLPPGFEIVADEIRLEPSQMDPLPDDAGAATGALTAARGVPAAIRAGGRFAANHVPGVQKTIGALFTAGAASAGGALGGIPGALAGGMIRGVTPSQAAIREGAGRLAGEAPAVARNAGRAMTTINYAKEAGVPLKPTSLVSTGEAARAVDNMADSMGQKVLRLYGPDNRMVVGPEMAPTPKAPGIVSRLARGAQTVGRVLSPLQIATGATDFAQAVEPERTDLGIAGVGRSQPTGGAEMDALAQQTARERRARADAETQMLSKIAAMLGL